jgi:imidazolonepropionase-like amidohydrolase
MRTTVHVGTNADVRLAVGAGVNGIEHTARGLSDETIAMMAAKKVTFTPTLVVLDWAWKRNAINGGDEDVRRLALPAIMQTFLDPKSPLKPMIDEGETSTTMARAFAGSLQQTAKAIRAGVPILAGSDAGNPVTFHGVSLVRELELLAQAGMPLTEVLKSATSRAADRMGQSSSDASRPAPSPTSSSSRRSHRASQCLPKDQAVYLGGRKLDDATLTKCTGAWRHGIRHANHDPGPKRFRDLGWRLMPG